MVPRFTPSGRPTRGIGLSLPAGILSQTLRREAQAAIVPVSLYGPSQGLNTGTRAFS